MAHQIRQLRRRMRVRRAVRRHAAGRPRLSIFRSSKNIYAQVIDDENGITIAAASTLDKTLNGVAPNDKAKTSAEANGAEDNWRQRGGNCEAAKVIGTLVARRAKEKGVTRVIFDRGGYLFHGRVKALADAARENGLEF